MSLDRRTLFRVGIANSLVGSFGASPEAQSAEIPAVDYSGPGFYLYPNWGVPVVYWVKTRPGHETQLDFMDPVSGAFLWSQGAEQTRNLAGKLSSWTVNHTMDCAF